MDTERRQINDNPKITITTSTLRLLFLKIRKVKLYLNFYYFILPILKKIQHNFSNIVLLDLFIYDETMLSIAYILNQKIILI